MPDITKEEAGKALFRLATGTSSPSRDIEKVLEYFGLLGPGQTAPGQFGHAVLEVAQTIPRTTARIPRIIADEHLLTSHEGWPVKIPTWRLEEIETNETARYDLINGAWIQRKPEEGSFYENASCAEYAIMYRGKVLAVIRARRFSNLTDSA